MQKTLPCQAPTPLKRYFRHCFFWIQLIFTQDNRLKLKTFLFRDGFEDIFWQFLMVNKICTQLPDVMVTESEVPQCEFYMTLRRQSRIYL